MCLPTDIKAEMPKNTVDKILNTSFGVQKFFNSISSGIIVGVFFIAIACLIFFKKGKANEDEN